MLYTYTFIKRVYVVEVRDY